MPIMTEHSEVITTYTNNSNQPEQVTNDSIKLESNNVSPTRDESSVDSSVVDSLLNHEKFAQHEDDQPSDHHAGLDFEHQAPDSQDSLQADICVKKESVYDAVVGANDQELAKRQYEDDDVDDYEDDMLSRSKRQARDSLAIDPSCDKYANVHDSSKESSSPVDNKFPPNGHSNNVAGGSPSVSSDMTQSSLGHSKHSDEPEQMRKLFIGGLDYKTSEDTLKRHFESFGSVIDCVVMREPQSKRSRGFGFVIYANSSMVDKAQLARPHEVDGREVQSKRAISREDSGKPEAQATVKKVYLGGLSDDIEETELRDYFKEFGNIVSINIMAHKDTGRRRGFAFVEYDDYDPVDKIVLKKFHSIKDKRVEAKKAVSKAEMDARKRADPRAAMASAMIAMSGPLPSMDGSSRSTRGSGRGLGGQNYLWDSPYAAASIHQGYPASALDGYPPHYHSPPGHYNTNWMMHGNGAGLGSPNNPYGFRSSHGGGGGIPYSRANYSAVAAAAAAAATVSGGWPEYGSFAGLSVQGAGPMRTSHHQHRGYRPYSSSPYGIGGNGGSIPPRRGYNP